MMTSREAAELACGVGAVDQYGRVKTFYTKFGLALERSFAAAVEGTVNEPPLPDVTTVLGDWEFCTSWNTKNSSGAKAASDRVAPGHLVQLLGQPRGGYISGVEFLSLHGVADPEWAAGQCTQQAIREARDIVNQMRLW